MLLAMTRALDFFLLVETYSGTRGPLTTCIMMLHSKG